MADSTTAADPKVQLTERDVEILVAAFQCPRGETFEIDKAALAAKLGFKTPASANTAWYKVKNKLTGNAQVAASSTDTTPMKPKATRQPKAPATDAGGAATNIVKNEPGKHIDAGVTEQDGVVDEDANENEPTADVAAGKGKAKVAAGTLTIEANGGMNSTIPSPPIPAPVTPKTPKTPKSVTKSKKAKAAEMVETVDDTATPTETGADASKSTPATPTPKKRVRKSKAQKDTEAAAAGETVDDDEEKPAKKARKTPAKKRNTESVGDGADAGDIDATSTAATTPAKPKTPRKPTGAAAKAKAKTANEANETEKAGGEQVDDDATPALSKDPKKAAVKKSADIKVTAEVPTTVTTADNVEVSSTVDSDPAAVELAKAILASDESQEI